MARIYTFKQDECLGFCYFPVASSGRRPSMQWGRSIRSLTGETITKSQVTNRLISSFALPIDE